MTSLEAHLCDIRCWVQIARELGKNVWVSSKPLLETCLSAVEWCMALIICVGIFCVIPFALIGVLLLGVICFTFGLGGYVKKVVLKEN